MLKSTQTTRNERKARRAFHVRNRLRREATCPRLSVHRSCKHISAQVIDDIAGRTICAVSTTAGALKGNLAGKTKSERAALLGTELARLACEAGVTQVVFDRGSFPYHGRIKALAEAARQGGLQF